MAHGGDGEKESAAPSAEPAAPPRGLPFPVVGIGASAGGFEALLTLLKHLPNDTGMAFVAVLHLDPHHKSKLPELIARGTSMPVVEIRDGLEPEPNHIYVTPPNVDVLLVEKRLRLARRAESERLHMTIDHFFISLAEEQGDRAIGIVLSGTGTDGTAGLATIKGEAGITFAEAEASAKYFGMPRSAIDSGCVDAVLTADALATELARIAQHPLLRPRKQAKSDEVFPEAADALAKIFFLLRQRKGVDFALYKHTTVKRRISRRMVLQRVESVDDYVTLLRVNPDEIEALFHDLLINVTGFFRDKAVYSALKKKIIPRIIKSKPSGGEVRVWVPGCATGEEAYSLAICLAEEISRAGKNLKLQIFGTDLSEMAIAKARAGVFPASISKDVSPERLRRFFARFNGGYQINRTVRDACTFARQDLCQDPPFSRLDLISCRNVLIYLGPELQTKCMPIFHYALNAGGFLMLGTSETVGAAGDLFQLMDKKNKIYAKKNVALGTPLDFSTRILPSARGGDGARLEPAAGDFARGPLTLQAHADKLILTHYAPPGLVIDTNLRVHEFRGQTGRFLEHTPVAATLNLLQMCRPSIVAELRITIQKAMKTRKRARMEGVKLKMDGSAHEICIEVVPFTVPPSAEVWLLVLFQDSDKSAAPEPPPVAGTGGRGKSKAGDRAEIARLRGELGTSQDSLQAIIEEQEATNEELKSANEEIESSNEELQSTNEELETAKEELQSTNEELTTLNEELSNRNIEMAQVNNDLNNLLSSINIPILMVDNDIAVRRVTPLAERLFNLIPTDLGRRLTDLKSNLQVSDLDAKIREVIDSLSAFEDKVQDVHGHWYSLRIRPYRTRENKIEGAVITLLDIDEDQRNLARLELASRSTEAILDTVHEPLVVLDSALRVRNASRAFYKTFKLAPKKTYGTHFCEIGEGEWDVLDLRQLLQEKLATSTKVETATAEIGFRQLGRRRLTFNARRTEGKGEPMIIVAIGDHTDGTSAKVTS